MAGPGPASRVWAAREFLGVTVGFAVALVIAPLVGGAVSGSAPVFATATIAAISVAYGRAAERLLNLPAAVPRYLVWVVTGFCAASLVHLTATAVLDIGVWQALVVDIAGAMAVTAAAAVFDHKPHGPPPSAAAELAAQMAVLIACATLASLWAREGITAVPQTLATGTFPAWQDYFLHASEISYLRDYPSFERHSQYLTAVLQPLYHRGSYALSAVFSALAGVPSLASATAFWLPTGLLLCITATYIFGAALGGALAGLGAVAAVFLTPDASSYWLHNRFLSFHWLLQMAGGSSYAVALVLVAVTRITTAPPERRARALLVAGAMTLMSAGFRVHVAALATGMVCVFAVLAWRPRVRAAGAAWALAVAAIAAGSLVWLESVSLAPHFLTSQARPSDFFLSVHSQASALPSPYIDWTKEHGAVLKVALGYPMMLLAGCGASLLVLAAVWRSGVLSRMGWRVAALPAAIAIAHLAVILLVPTPAHGDPTDFGHRPFVLVYLLVGALAGAGAVRLLCDWSARRVGSATVATAVVIALALAGVSVPVVTGARVQQTWTPQYAEISVPRAAFEAATYVRRQSQPGALVQSASEDPQAVMVAITERRGYLSRTSLYRSLGPDTATVADRRAAEHASVVNATSYEQLQAFGERTGVAWYIADTPASQQWPAAVQDRRVFGSGAVSVYHLR
ncbi:MAG TPA: hypothetical protein VMW48_15420 [Vicinamibacterales bacterium]|nr:hypothetical protein [Vicinamibacterales bacterium]